MRSRTVSRDDVLSIYKIASSGMVKKALELNDDAKAALVGALGGAGVGLFSHLVTPKDDDENQTSRLLSHVLAGAALGGLSGYGLKRLHSRVSDVMPENKEPNWIERNTPELTYSRAATLGGLGTGAYAAKKTVDALRGTYGIEGLERLSGSARTGVDAFVNANPKDFNNPGAKLLRKARDAYGVANKFSLKDKILARLPGWTPKLLGGNAIRGAKSRRAAADIDLFNALRELGGKKRVGQNRILPGNPNAQTAVKSFLSNPRKLIRSLRAGPGKRKLLMALISAGLLTTGAAIRSQNRN